MRMLDWGAKIDEANYHPTLFDEIVIKVGDRYYELTELRVLVAGGDDGPGLIAYVAGPEIPELHEGA